MSAGGASEKILPFWDTILGNSPTKLLLLVHYFGILTTYPNSLFWDFRKSPEFIILRSWRRARIHYDDSLSYPPYTLCIAIVSLVKGDFIGRLSHSIIEFFEMSSLCFCWTALPRPGTDQEMHHSFIAKRAVLLYFRAICAIFLKRANVTLRWDHSCNTHFMRVT